jgi:hypothetical protein
MYSRGGHDVQAALKIAFEKDIARKKRQKEQLGSICPLAGDLIEWE